MDIKELKFLLKLLGKQDYRASITELKPNSKTPASERDRICRQLGERDLVGYSEEIQKLKIAPPGQSLLKLDPAGLPVTPQELKILQACEKGAITPGKTNITPAKTRQALIDSLAHRGFIEPVQTKIKDVWLTEPGKEYLREEYMPLGAGNLTMTKAMLADYLRFLRNTSKTAVSNDEEILQIIQDLDRQLGTDNYLPIFYLRDKLQPPLSREELDQALYRLERQDKIELSALQEVRAYTSEQIEAGIPQDIGGPLFFIIVT
ncbi:MAG: hypothetical protein RIB93_12630 [Coleofasciculus sp. D1-CHI-01]|uniref:hypothetical protein n=1 Tax=Coleofasciculus sp. D1-CHI-01 TaxID=3068482 RepID=UPI0032F1AF57